VEFVAWTRRQVGRCLLVVVSGALLAGCSDSKASGGGAIGASTTAVASQPAAGAPGSTQRVAVQLGDLPPGFRSCDFAGEITSYIENHKGGRQSTYQNLVSTWEELKSMGAVEGWYAVYGDGAAACDFMIGRPTPHGADLHDDNARGHPSTVFTFVARYTDEAAAASTYGSGLFGQDNLRAPQFEVVRGDPTGLGPNSVVASNRASAPVTRAIWQAKAFTVVYGSENLKGSEPQAVLDAVYGRIGNT